VFQYWCCHKTYIATFDNGNFTRAPFDTTMTMDKEPRQHQKQRQQSLSQALSLLRGGSDQPDQHGSGMPGLQPRARMSPEGRTFLLSTIEQALAILSGVDDDVSILVSLPLVSSSSDNDEDNGQAHYQ
jgi:hypothetical protein